MSSSCVTLVSATAPTPLVVAHIPRSAPIAPATTNPVDDFFGVAAHFIPDKYAMRAAEPVTLAMYLFKFGFRAIPPFWIMGVIILLSPLRAPAPTAAERALILKRMRTVELKWARRCLYALLGLIHIIIALVIGVVVWHALRKM
ncbi:hypothetical protein B0H17DRAFT_1340292 [Mycena rosella]|uniref:Uncharacterized protein n=1 Tax=Mycena rosella TaxID=1033263 RepID=A0AAD7FKK3_MYCRO|nr:hypothetical protein B0H17DRAFT_1340292 [Mycena rosella]